MSPEDYCVFYTESEAFSFVAGVEAGKIKVAKIEFVGNRRKSDKADVVLFCRGAIPAEVEGVAYIGSYSSKYDIEQLLQEAGLTGQGIEYSEDGRNWSSEIPE